MKDPSIPQAADPIQTCCTRYFAVNALEGDARAAIHISTGRIVEPTSLDSTAAPSVGIREVPLPALRIAGGHRRAKPILRGPPQRESERVILDKGRPPCLPTLHSESS